MLSVCVCVALILKKWLKRLHSVWPWRTKGFFVVTCIVWIQFPQKQDPKTHSSNNFYFEKQIQKNNSFAFRCGGSGDSRDRCIISR